MTTRIRVASALQSGSQHALPPHASCQSLQFSKRFQLFDRELHQGLSACCNKPSPCLWLTVAGVYHTAESFFCATGNICHMHLRLHVNASISSWARQSTGACDVQAVQNVEIERKLAGEQQLQQKQARKAELRDAHLKQIKRKALNETTKVHEVLFINKLQKEDKELTLMQRMQVYLPSLPSPPLLYVCRHMPGFTCCVMYRTLSSGNGHRAPSCCYCYQLLPSPMCESPQL